MEVLNETFELIKATVPILFRWKGIDACRYVKVNPQSLFMQILSDFEGDFLSLNQGLQLFFSITGLGQNLAYLHFVKHVLLVGNIKLKQAIKILTTKTKKSSLLGIGIRYRAIH